MTVKEKVIHAVQDLPEDASIEDAMERLFFLSKIEKGIQQANSGQTLSHVQVREKYDANLSEKLLTLSSLCSSF